MIEEKFYVFKKLLDNYRHVAAGSSSATYELIDMEVNEANLGDWICGKAWLSSYIYTYSAASYTPFRPIFKTGVENQGISGISWLLNYMPVSEINLTLGDYRLAFLYPYKSSGFNIKLSYNDVAIESYNEYMSLMYSKENFPPENFLLEDDDFKPMPVLIPKETETENIVDFCGSLSCFDVDSGEVMDQLDKTARINYRNFIKENKKPLCISICGEKSHIKTEIFKDFRNSRYNVKYGVIAREYKIESETTLPGFIPDIPHAVCGKIGAIDPAFKAPAFSSTPNYGINKTKAISSSCGPVLFNYVQGNIVSLSVFYNLNDKKQKAKMEESLSDFFSLLKHQLEEYMETNFKCQISFLEK